MEAGSRHARATQGGAPCGGHLRGAFDQVTASLRRFGYEGRRGSVRPRTRRCALPTETAARNVVDPALGVETTGLSGPKSSSGKSRGRPAPPA